MKMKCIVIVALIFASFTAGAQGFHLGVKGGANVNKLASLAFKDGFTFGYHAGAFAEIRLSKKFWIQPEVLFNQSNLDTANKISAIYTINKVNSIQLNYISIPIFLNFNVTKALALQAGPQYGILLNNSHTLLVNGKNAFKNGDFSLLGGLQLKFASFRLYGRYAVGLSNINDVSNTDQWKSQSIQVGIGFALL